MQLHARGALQAGRHQVDRDRPRLVPEVAALHRRARLGREELAAVAAAERHPGMRRLGLDVHGAAPDARDPVRPTGLGDPLLGSSIVRKHPEDVHQREAVAVVLARCVVRHIGTIVTVPAGKSRGFSAPLVDHVEGIRDTVPQPADERQVEPVSRGTGPAGTRPPTRRRSVRYRLSGPSASRRPGRWRPLWRTPTASPDSDSCTGIHGTGFGVHHAIRVLSKQK